VKFFTHSGGKDYELDIQPDRDRLVVKVEGRELVVLLDDVNWAIRTAFVGDRRLDFGWQRRDGTYTLQIEGIEYEVEVRDPKMELLSRVVAKPGLDPASVEVKAPIPGLISKVLVKAGETVAKGRPVLCLDAMKLENEIAAPRDGVVKSVLVSPGQPVEKGQSLFVVG
jgi:biotin carboxyl carrier protein